MLLIRRLGYLSLVFIGLIIIGQVLSYAHDQQRQVVLAQSDDAAACDTLIQEALAEVATTCLNIGRNEVCYGHSRVSATLTDDSYFFEQPGDIVPVSVLEAIVTRSSNPNTGDWGIALMDVQADLPSGEDSVRMVMFGGLEATPASDQLVSHDVTCDVTNTTGENVNLRAGAGLNYRAVEVLDNNDTLPVYGQSENGEWLRSNRGWVSRSVISMGDCDRETLPIFAANEDSYTSPMQAFTLQVNDAAMCEATPPGMLIQVPEGQTANIMVNNVELRIGSTAFVTLVENDDSEDSDSLLVANLGGNVYATGNNVSQHIFPGSQSLTPLGSNGLPTGAPQGIEPFSENVQMLPDVLLSSTLNDGISVPEPLDFSPPPTDSSSSTDGGVPLGEWGACGSCSTCIGPGTQCRVDPSGACVWDAAGCAGIGVGPSVSCSNLCGGSWSFMVGPNNSFDIIYSSSDGAILSGVLSNSGGLGFVSSSESFVSDTQYTVDFSCMSTGGPGTFTVDIYDTNGMFFQVGFTITCL